MLFVEQDPDKLIRERLNAAMARRGIKSQAELARRLNVEQPTVNRWFRGENAPRGPNLDDLCRELAVTSDYLFGRDEHAARHKRLLDEIAATFGRGTAEAVEHLGRLTDHHRAIVAARVVGWVEGLEEQERQQMPRMPIDDDRERLLAEATDEESPASELPSREPSFAEPPQQPPPR